MPDVSTNMRLKLPVVCLILEIILIILFGVLVEYDTDTDSKKFNVNFIPEKTDDHNGHSAGTSNDTAYQNEFYYRYPSKFDVDQESICDQEY